MRVEIVAVGTELLLGQIVDTNSWWIAGQLSAHGIDSYYQTRVGDNIDRIATAIRGGLARSDAVVVCGGLGPTQDDVTREALAMVMNVPLVRDNSLVAAVRERFVVRHRTMPENNLRQADVPLGAKAIAQSTGTAPGLICPVGRKVVYALPGVPTEMKEMIGRSVLPDLVGRRGGTVVIASRSLRTWGTSESRIAEIVAGRVTELDLVGGGTTIAFLASGIEGIKVRLTVRAADRTEADRILDEEEQRLRVILGELVFGVDDQGIEDAVAEQIGKRSSSLATAESLTGGLVAARLVSVPGASKWFRGSIVAYDPQVKYSMLGVARGPVVTEEAACQMAEGVRSALGAGIGLSLTGVAGPEPVEGLPPGTVIVGLAGISETSEAVRFTLPGDRQSVRELAAISALDLLRRRLAAGFKVHASPDGAN